LGKSKSQACWSQLNEAIVYFSRSGIVSRGVDIKPRARPEAIEISCGFVGPCEALEVDGVGLGVDWALDVNDDFRVVGAFGGTNGTFKVDCALGVESALGVKDGPFEVDATFGESAGT